MEALIMMLINITEQTYHPIMYFGHSLPEGTSNLCEFESQGHRKKGFKERADALTAIETEIIPWARKRSTQIYKQVENDIPWDGEAIPPNNQLISKEDLEKLPVA